MIIYTIVWSLFLHSLMYNIELQVRSTCTGLMELILQIEIWLGQAESNVDKNWSSLLFKVGLAGEKKKQNVKKVLFSLQENMRKKISFISWWKTPSEIIFPQKIQGIDIK